MALNKSFILISILMTSGFLLCTSVQTDQKKLQSHPNYTGIRQRSIMSRMIGIHLGTTYSSVAVYKHPAASEMRFCTPLSNGCDALSFHDSMEAVMNEHGNTAMPSCVSFTDDSGVLIGEPAKAQEALNSERTICGINRLIGRRFDDPEVQSYIKNVPYKVVNKENIPHIEVKFKNGETKIYSPEEICAIILGKLKEIAETYMGNDAVTVAISMSGSHLDINKLRQSVACYNKLRQSVTKACAIAGLKDPYVGTSKIVVGLIGYSYWSRENFRVLVLDLGGSAFSAILEDHDEMGAFLTPAAKEDMHLGGQTFDTRLVDYFVSLIKSKYNKDISKDLVALTQLRSECEKAKISLSSSDRVMINVQFTLADDGILIFEEILTRETFEELNMDLFNKTIDLVEAVLEEGGLEKTQIDEIVLIGGSGEIPMIQHLVKNYLGKEPLNVVNPKEANAFAATQLAGKLYVPGHVVLNSMSIGIETLGGTLTRFIEFETPLPSARSRDVTTYYDGQTTMEIKVFEAHVHHHHLTKYGHYLGSLQISNLPPAPRLETTVNVTVEVDLDENIRVTAEHKATQNKQSIIIPKEERDTDTSREIISRDFYGFVKKYEEEVRVWNNIKTVMSLFPLQPRSLSFGVLEAFEWIRFEPQYRRKMCRLQ